MKRTDLFVGILAGKTLLDTGHDDVLTRQDVSFNNFSGKFITYVAMKGSSSLTRRLMTSG
jgi:hypothetical protein